MKIAEVIGTVTLNRAHPSFQNARLKLAVPLTLQNLLGSEAAIADPIVVWDELGAHVGSQIALSEGREAAQPFHPAVKPVDAYNAALLDEVVLDEGALRIITAET